MADIKEWIEIATAEDFNNIRSNPNANYRQVADIDMSGYSSFEPIPELNGDYDGQMFKISNLTIATPSDSAPFLKTTGILKNMQMHNIKVVTNGNIIGTIKASGISSYNTGEIYNCYVGGIVLTQSAFNGWQKITHVLCGIANGGTIYNSSCDASVSAVRGNKRYQKREAYGIGGKAYNCIYLGSSELDAIGNSKSLISFSTVRCSYVTAHVSLEKFKEDILSGGILSRWFRLSDGGIIPKAYEEINSLIGLKHEPVLISTEDELDLLRSPFATHRYYRQINDIILTKWGLGEGWDALSRTARAIYYDGQGYSIKGLYINSDKAYSSLFGYNTGLVKRVVIEDAVVIGGTSGSISAIQHYGTIESCVVSGYFEFSSLRSGVLSGYGSTIKNCYSDAEVVAKLSSIGALSTNSAIIGCIFNGSIRDGSIMQNLNGLQPIQVGAVTDCFYNVDTTFNLVGTLNGTPLSTEGLKQEDKLVGLDFNVDWNINSTRNSGFPYPSAAIMYKDGDGSLERPFLLFDYFDLNQVRHFIDGYNFRLANDIEMPDTDFVTIEGLNNSVFDGGGLSIANLHTNSKGLFGDGENNVVKNLTIVNPYITLGTAGMLCKIFTDSIITNCSFISNSIDSFVAYGDYNSGYIATVCKELSNCIIKINLRGLNSGGHCFGLVYYTASISRCIVDLSTLDIDPEIIKYCLPCGLTGEGTAKATDCIVYGDPNFYFGLGINVTNSLYIGESARHNAGSSKGCYASEGTQQGSAGAAAVEIKDAVMKNQAAFPFFDFVNVWEMGEDHPVLKDVKEVFPPAIAFKNKHGLYYSDYQGNILRHVEYGNVLAGNESGICEIFVENNTSDPVTEVVIQIMDETVREGITPTISKVEDWVEVNDKLVFNDILKVKESIPFYVKFKAAEDVKMGGTFDMKVKAIPYLGEISSDENIGNEGDS